MFCKQGVLKKRLLRRYFPWNIAKFLKTSILKNICEWQLLIISSSSSWKSISDRCLYLLILLKEAFIRKTFIVKFSENVRTIIWLLYCYKIAIQSSPAISNSEGIRQKGQDSAIFEIVQLRDSEITPGENSRKRDFEDSLTSGQIGPKKNKDIMRKPLRDLIVSG